jgi:hypothetical protein
MSHVSCLKPKLPKIFPTFTLFIGASVLLLGWNLLGSDHINPVSAQAADTINFQGKIVNKPDDTNLTPGTPACVVNGSNNDTCDFRVSIFNAASGGTLMWQEVHPNVEIDQYNGLFNLNLNDNCNDWTPFFSFSNCTNSPTVQGIDWTSNPNLWIEIDFSPAGNNSWTEKFSRKPFDSVPHAYHADDADRLGGITADGFVQLQPAGVQSVTGTSSNTLIHIDYTGLGNPRLIDLQVAGTSAFRVLNNGNAYISGRLGVGNFSPSEAVDVIGNIQVSGDILTTQATTESATEYFQNIKPKPVLNGTTSEWDIARSIEALPSGNFLVTGEFFGTTNFGGVVDSSLNAAAPDWFTVKYDPNFNVIWQQRIGGLQADVGSNATADSLGNVYASGFIFGTAQRQNAPSPSAGFTNISTLGFGATLIKYDSNGNVQWHRFVDGSGLDGGQGVAVDTSDNVYFTGLFSGSANVTGCGSISAPGGGDSAFIIKYNSAGGCIWARAWGSTGSDVSWDITYANNAIYVSGEKGTPSQRAFIRKYDLNGNYLWEVEMNSASGNDVAYSPEVDDAGNVYVAVNSDGGLSVYQPNSSTIVSAGLGNV